MDADTPHTNAEPRERAGTEPRLRLLVSVTRDWAIGKNGAMLVRNPADLKRFKELTTGHVVLMGRRTLESLPGGRPLPHRRNIVLSRSSDLATDLGIEDVEVAHGLKEAKELAGVGKGDVWVIGGEAVYRSFLPCVDECLVTFHDIERPDADTWFPNLDEHPAFELATIEPGGTTADGVDFEYRTYRRRRCD